MNENREWKKIGGSYMVLSVANINRLAKLAKMSKKRAKGSRNHCLVLHADVIQSVVNGIPSGNPAGEFQLSSVSFNSDVDRQLKVLKDDEDRFAAWAIKSVDKMAADAEERARTEGGAQ